MTRTQKPTRKESAQVKSVPPGVTIENCSFSGVKWDGPAIAAMQTIAEGLQENAKALGALASVFRAANVTIETMVKVESPLKFGNVTMHKGDV